MSYYRNRSNRHKPYDYLQHTISFYKHKPSKQNNPYHKNNSQQKMHREKSFSLKYKDNKDSRDNRQIRENKDNKALDYLKRGKKYYKENKLSKAVEFYKKSLALDGSLIQNHYLLGVVNILLNKYNQSEQHFLQLLHHKPTFRKNVYLLLSITYKKQNKLQKAIETINRGMKIYPDYHEGQMFRCKLFVKIKKFMLAEEGYRKLGNKVGIADCRRFLLDYQQAIRIYTQAIIDQPLPQTYLKRAIAYLDCHKLQLCQSDINYLISIPHDNIEIYYIKGVLESKKHNRKQAINWLQQVIESKLQHNNIKIITKGFEQLIRIKISQRDFYQAYHYVQRYRYLQINSQLLKVYSSFIQVVILMMKKKYSQSLQQFPKVITSLQYIHEGVHKSFLQPLCYLYNSFPMFCLSKHRQALKYYQKYCAIKNNHNVDQSVKYNMDLCRGIICQLEARDGKPWFQKAQQRLTRMETYFYKAAIYVKQALQNHSQSYFLKAMNQLHLAIQINDCNANIFYYKALLQCYLCQFQQALQSIDKAIDKSQDNIARYFFLRGIIFALTMNYQQAISDISIALSLHNPYPQASYQLALCQIQAHQQLQFQDNQQLLAYYFWSQQMYEQMFQLYKRGVQGSKIQIMGTWTQGVLNIIQRVSCRDTQIQQQLSRCIQKKQALFFNISQKDLYFFRGLSSFYTNIQSSIKDIKYTLFLYAAQNDCIQNEAKAIQMKFNLMICYLFKKSYDKALQLISSIRQQTQGISERLQIVQALIYYQLQQNQSNYKILEQSDQEISILPIDDRLCQKFPSILLPYKFKVLYYYQKKIRLSFDWPNPPEINLQPFFKKEYLEQFNILCVQNKPEAPWIRRNEQGIIFTDNIEHIQLNLVSQQQQQQKAQMKNLRLDSNVQRKLQKLMNQKKE